MTICDQKRLFDQEESEMSKRDVGDGRIAGKYARHTEVTEFRLKQKLGNIIKIIINHKTDQQLHFGPSPN